MGTVFEKLALKCTTVGWEPNLYWVIQNFRLKYRDVYLYILILITKHIILLILNFLKNYSLELIFINYQRPFFGLTINDFFFQKINKPLCVFLENDLQKAEGRIFFFFFGCSCFY